MGRRRLPRPASGPQWDARFGGTLGRATGTAGFVGAGVAAQQRASLCPAPEREELHPGNGQTSALLPQQRLVFSVQAVLSPAFGA